MNNNIQQIANDVARRHKATLHNQKQNELLGLAAWVFLWAVTVRIADWVLGR